MNWKALCLLPEQDLLEALAVINAGSCRLALVMGEGETLLGVLSDGDIRRALLRGHTLETLVAEVMTRSPITVQRTEGQGTALLRLLQHNLEHIPVLDEKGRICELWSLQELLHFKPISNPVVIMAGGLGTRLAPLTDEKPKPMLPVGGQPLLELILRHFVSQGFRQFYIAVNYKADCITGYFGNGGRMGVSITYLRETRRLGTAGALSLMPHPVSPCIVMNGDILTRLDFPALLRAHEEHRVPATLVVKRHTIQIPYGVVSQDKEGRLSGIEEKPQHSFAISAGISVLSPEVLSLIPTDTYFDMPDLYEAMLRHSMRPAVYEMSEYWVDIGQLSDYRQANEDFDLYSQWALR